MTESRKPEVSMTPMEVKEKDHMTQMEEDHPRPFDPGITEQAEDPFVIAFPYDFALIYNVDSEDSKAVAEALTTAIEVEGLQGYLEHRDGVWRENNKDVEPIKRIFTTLRMSKYLIVLFDKDSGQNNFIKWEQEIAFKEVLEAGQLCRYIPVVVGGSRRERVPRYIPNFCLEFEQREISPGARKVRRLVKTIKQEITSAGSFFGLMSIN